MAYASSLGHWRARDELLDNVSVYSVVGLIAAKWIFS
jgi:hypothetical protein